MARLKALGIGVAIDGEDFDHGHFGDALALDNYDAVVVDLAEVSNFIEAVRLGHPSLLDSSGTVIRPTSDRHSPGEVSLIELLDQRAAEARRLIHKGGLLICFLCPNKHHPIGTQPRWSHSWLPSPRNDMYHPGGLLTADGPVEYQIPIRHPFAQFFMAFKGQLRFRAAFTEELVGSVPGLIEIARNPGGLLIAGEFPVPNESGKLIFLPTIAVEDPPKTGGVLYECIVKTLSENVELSPPDWAEEWNLPGFAEREELVAKAEDAVREAKTKLAQTETDRDKVGKFRQLLWTTGKFQLEPVVRDAFSLMGFEVEPEGDKDAVLYSDGQKVAIVEIEGTSGRIDVDKYRQLLDYVQKELLENYTELKGILVGNGYRNQPPENREVQFTEGCIRGAISQQFCLLATTSLFDMVRTLMEDPSEPTKKRLRDDLLGAVGCYDFPKQESSDGC